jgi:hypothetical protein
MPRACPDYRWRASAAREPVSEPREDWPAEVLVASRAEAEAALAERRQADPAYGWQATRLRRARSQTVLRSEDAMSERTERAQARYEAALHAVQTGVAYEMEKDGHSTQPKHLRVGIDARACDHAALVRLLIEKHVITKAEYLDAIADEMEREQQRYTERINELYAAHD